MQLTNIGTVQPEGFRDIGHTGTTPLCSLPGPAVGLMLLPVKKSVLSGVFSFCSVMKLEGSAEPSTEETTLSGLSRRKWCTGFTYFSPCRGGGKQGSRGWGWGHEVGGGHAALAGPRSAGRAAGSFLRASPGASACVRWRSLAGIGGVGGSGDISLLCPAGEFPGAPGTLPSLLPPLTLSYFATQGSCPGAIPPEGGRGDALVP